MNSATGSTDYRLVYTKRGRIAFLEELRGAAEAAGIEDWDRFAAAMAAWLRRELDTALRRLKRRDEALAAYERASALEPDYPDPWEVRSRALAALGRHDEAAARVRFDMLKAAAQQPP